MEMENNTLPKSLPDMKWLPYPLEMADMLYQAGVSPWNFVLKHSISYTSALNCFFRNYSFNGLLKSLPNVKHGDLVCCCQGANKIFRAVVLDLLPDDRVKVLMVDYNILKIVNQKEIFILPTDLNDVPVQCVYCCLIDLNDEDEKIWNNDFCDIFKTIVSENRLYINAEDKPLLNSFPPKFSVELFAHNSSSKLRLNVNKWICQKVLPELKQVDQSKEYDDLVPFLSEKAIEPFHMSVSEPESYIAITEFPIQEDEIDTALYGMIQLQRVRSEVTRNFPYYIDDTKYALMDPNVASGMIRNPQTKLDSGKATSSPGLDHTKPHNCKNSGEDNICTRTNQDLSSHESIDHTKPHNLKKPSEDNICTRTNPNLSSHESYSKKQFKKNFSHNNMYSWAKKILSSNENKTHNLKKSSGENDVHSSTNKNSFNHDDNSKTHNLEESIRNDMHSSINNDLSWHERTSIPSHLVQKYDKKNTDIAYEDFSWENNVQDWINSINLNDLGDPTEVCDTFFDIGTCNCWKCTCRINYTKESHPDLLVPPEMLLPNIGEQVTMRILNVISCHLFFAALLPGYTAINDVMKDINHPVNTKSYLNIPNVSSGQFVLAKGSDGLFRRAEVMDVKSDQVEAFFVDFGYSEAVEKGNLRQIYQRFLNLPRQAILSSLPTIIADNDTAAHNTLALKINDKEVNAVILKKRNCADSRIQVNLLLEDGDCITNFMKRNGHNIYE